MNRDTYECPGTQSQHKPYHNLSNTVLSALFVCLGFSIVSHHGIAAEPKASAENIIFAFDISAGGLEEALSRFATQTGIHVSFDAAEVKGKRVEALKGNFSVEVGLNQLLAGSDLEAIRGAGGYVMKKSTASATDTAAKAAINTSANAATNTSPKAAANRMLKNPFPFMQMV